MGRYVKIILLKEFREILRDKITFIMLLIEIASIPVLMFSMGYIYKNNIEKMKVILLENQYSNKNEFENFLKNIDDINIILKRENNKNIVDSDVLVLFTEEGIEFIYNSNSYNSYEYSKKLYSMYQDYYLENYLKNNDKKYTISLVDENGKVADESRNILNVFIPLILIIIATQGTMEIAAGLIAGEREKGTLELLLLNIEDKKEILFGKVVVLVSVNIISILTGLFTILLSSCYFQQEIIQKQEDYLKILILLILVAVTFSLIAMGLSMIIKSYRSAQLVIGIVISVPSVLMGAIAYGTTLKWDALMLRIPIINLIETVHKVCFGKLTFLNFVYCIVSNGFVIIMIWILDMRLMKTELI